MFIIRTGQPFMVELIDLVNFILNDLTQIINFPTQIPDCHSLSLALLDLLFFSYSGICSTMTFPPLRNSDNLVVSVSIDYPSNSKQYASFYCIAFCANWYGFHYHLRDIAREDVFKLSASAAASEFCELVQVGIYVCIPYCKYQIKPHSSPWFLAASFAVIIRRNHFSYLYQMNKSYESKVKCRQSSNCCKSVFEAANLISIF